MQGARYWGDLALTAAVEAQVVALRKQGAGETPLEAHNMAVSQTSSAVRAFLMRPRLRRQTVPDRRPDYASLVMGSGVPLHSDPRYGERTDIPACSFSTPIPQC